MGFGVWGLGFGVWGQVTLQLSLTVSYILLNTSRRACSPLLLALHSAAHVLQRWRTHQGRGQRLGARLAS